MPLLSWRFLITVTALAVAGITFGVYKAHQGASSLNHPSNANCIRRLDGATKTWKDKNGFSSTGFVYPQYCSTRMLAGSSVCFTFKTGEYVMAVPRHGKVQWKRFSAHDHPVRLCRTSGGDAIWKETPIKG